MSVYELSEVREAVTKLLAVGDIEGARQCFAEAIFDWTDHFNENFTEPSSAQKELNSISSLWLAYAEMENDQKQYKKAAAVYEKAFQDPLASMCTAVYLTCANFWREKGKLNNAKSVLIKGVTAKIVCGNIDAVWIELLKVIQDSGAVADIKLLYEAIKQEKGNAVLAPSDALLSGAANNVTAPTEPMQQLVGRENTYSTVEHKDSTIDATEPTAKAIENVSLTASPARAVNINRVEASESVLKLEPEDMTCMAPEVLFARFPSRPSMLFSLSDKVRKL